MEANERGIADSVCNAIVDIVRDDATGWKGGHGEVGRRDRSVNKRAGVDWEGRSQARGYYVQAGWPCR